MEQQVTKSTGTKPLTIWFIESGNDEYTAINQDTTDIELLQDLHLIATEYQLSALQNVVCYELGRSNLHETWTDPVHFDDMMGDLPHAKQQEILRLCLHIFNTVNECVSVSFRVRCVDEEKRKNGMRYAWYLCIITEQRTNIPRLDRLLGVITDLRHHKHIVNRVFKQRK